MDRSEIGLLGLSFMAVGCVLLIGIWLRRNPERRRKEEGNWVKK